MHLEISYSQASTFEKCQRRWQYEKILNYPAKPQPQLIYGSKMHQQIEDYLNGLVLPGLEDPNAPATKAVELIKKWNPKNYEVERYYQMELETDNQVLVRGKADVVLEMDDYRAIVDWKSSQKKPTAKKADGVRTQLSLYAYMAGLNNGDKIIAAYPQWPGAVYSMPYEKSMGEQSMAWISSIAAKMKESIKIAIDGDLLEATPTKLCNWCPYQDNCPQAYKGD